MTKQDWELVKAELRAPTLRWPTFCVVVLNLIGLAASWRLKDEGRLGATLSVLLLTLVLHHAYLLLHEATHSAVAKSKRINVLIGHVCGWLIAVPYLTRQRSHLLHHSWTGHPEGDPANKRVIERFAVMSEGEANRLERIWKSWIPILTLNDRIGLWRDAARHHRNKPAVVRFVREMRANQIYVVAYGAALLILLWAGHIEDLATWYLPAWALQLALDELVNLPHHAETPLLSREDSALPLWEQHRVTHSCKSVWFWSSCVLLNFNLHTAHHLFPWVPWSGLPSAHRKLLSTFPELRSESQTHDEFSWSFRNRQRSLLTIMGPYFDKIPTAAERNIPLSEAGA